jgi:hypothetical protein
MDLAAPYIELHVVKRPDPREALADPGHAKKRLSH